MRKKFFFLILTAFSVCRLVAQEDSVKYYIDEGIKWHDAGNYDAAIEMYDKANRLKPGFVASYEKSYSLFHAKRFDECIALCSQIIKQYKAHPDLKDVYINYGSALDEKGDAVEALAAYDEGMKIFPDSYLLAYNKGLTLFKMDKKNEAEIFFQKALELKPLHASSNYAIGIVLKNKNKVPSLLADVTFLLIERQGERASEVVQRIEEVFSSNISEGKNGGVTISINSDLLNRKNEVDNFSMAEINMSLMSGLDKDSVFKNENPPQRLKRKLDLLISSLKEGKKSSKGFYWKHYVPFFTEMKQKEFIEVAANLCYFSTGDEGVKKWIELNDSKVNSFYNWIQSYQWKN